MKRIMLVLTMVLILTLSACTNEKTVYCKDYFGDIEITYDDDGVISGSIYGEDLEGDLLEDFEKDVNRYGAQGFLAKMDKSLEDYVEDMDGRCSFEEGDLDDFEPVKPFETMICVDGQGGTEVFMYNSEGLVEYTFNDDVISGSMLAQIETGFKSLWPNDDFVKVMENLLIFDTDYGTSCSMAD